jgi:hypothetical protein
MLAMFSVHFCHKLKEEKKKKKHKNKNSPYSVGGNSSHPKNKMSQKCKNSTAMLF